MAPAHDDLTGPVITQVARRWQALDPLLPEPSVPPDGCGQLFIAGPAGAPTAVATCNHWTGEPGTLEMCWGAARRFGLTAQVAGPDVTGALDALLSAWRDHLSAQPGLDDGETSATVSWPSRDVEGVAALLHHGMQPMAVVAVRPMHRSAPPGRLGEPGGELPAGLRIRRAGPADLDAVVPLEHEVVRYDAYFGEVVDRPWTADALRAEAAPARGVAGRTGRPAGRRAERPAPGRRGLDRPADRPRAGGLQPAHRGQPGRARDRGRRCAGRPLPRRGGRGRGGCDPAAPHPAQPPVGAVLEPAGLPPA